MNPVTSIETIRIIHDAMVREELERRRYRRAEGSLLSGLRATVARALVAAGTRLDATAAKVPSAELAVSIPRSRSAA